MQTRKLDASSFAAAGLSPRLLLIEDDAAVRGILDEALTDAGYRVTAAADGEEAIEHLSASRDWAAILLDLSMPVVNGWAVRAWQLQQPPSVARIPVVIITAGGWSPRSLELIGAAACFAKPFDLDVLLDTLDDLTG